MSTIPAERRQQIIQQLLSKRNALQLQTQQPPPPPRQEDESSESHEYHPQPNLVEKQYEEPLHVNVPASGPYQNDISPSFVPRTAWETGPSSIGGSTDTPQSTRIRERSHSAGRGVSRMDSFSSLGLGAIPRAADDSALDSRAHRIAQAEAAIKAEMFKECTFRPKINTRHRSLSSSDDATPFYDRAKRWQMNKDADDAKRKSIIDSTTKVECTFRPKINRNSVKAVKEIRGDGDVSERLYRGSEEIAVARTRFIEEELRKEREAEARLCTFQPQLATDKTKFNYIPTKYNRPPEPKLPIEPPQEVKECSFTPKIKGVRPSMASAKLYLEANVVERLSKPVISANASTSEQDFENDRPIMDMASFMNSINNFSTPSTKRISSNSGNQNQASRTIGNKPNRERDRATTPTNTLSAEERERRKSQFNDFIGRQEQSLARKERNISQVEKHVTPNFTPKICRQSKVLAKQHSQADFLDRMEQAAVKKTDTETRRQSGADAENCTFRPQISKKSQNLRPRSAYELSKGDMFKLETKRTSIAQRREIEETKQMPFKPQISARAKTKKSQLSDPGALLDNYREKLNQREQERNEILKQREEKELEVCTFAPSTGKCPSYISKIAASMEAINRARGPTAYVVDDSKPLWR